MSLTAKDIMARNVVFIRPGASVREAMELIVTHRITGLPVVGEHGELVGVVSEKDVLHMYYVSEQMESLVSDIMTEEVKCFDEDDGLDEICEHLIQVPFRRVPILSRGCLVGIISRTDFIKYLLSLHKPEAE